MTDAQAGRSFQDQAAAGAMWTGAGMACLSLCGYLNAVMLARGLGPAAFGIYGVVYSVLLASEQMLRFGIPQALARLINSGRAHDVGRLESTGIWLVLIVNFAGFAVMWVAAPWLSEWLNLGNGALYIRIAILDLPFFGMYRVLLHIMSGRRNFRASGTATCTYAIARAAGIALLLAFDMLTIEGALFVNAAASVAGFLRMVPPAGLRSFRPTLSERSNVVSSAIPIAVGDVAIQCLLGIDLWLLSAIGVTLTAGVRGHYVAALSLARGPNIAAYVLVTVLVPLIARAEASGQHEAAQRLVTGTTRLLVTLVLPVCALVAVNASDLMSLFFGDSYREGASQLAILVLSQGFGFTLLSSFQAIMIGTGMARASARLTYVGLAAAIVLNLVLIPRFGPIGAALASLLAFSVASGLIGRAVRHRIGALFDARRDLLAIAATVAVATLSWFIHSGREWVVVEMAVLGVAYLAIAWQLGLINAADVALLRGKKGREPEPP